MIIQPSMIRSYLLWTCVSVLFVLLPFSVLILIETRFEWALVVVTASLILVFLAFSWLPAVLLVQMLQFEVDERSLKRNSFGTSTIVAHDEIRAVHHRGFLVVVVSKSRRKYFLIPGFLLMSPETRFKFVRFLHETLTSDHPLLIFVNRYGYSSDNPKASDS